VSADLRPLPPHVVRESCRTRHVHLRFSIRGGLEVVVPVGFDRDAIPALLEEKARWIERAKREVEAQRALLDPSPHDRLPERIELRALGEVWIVDATSTDASRISLRERPGRRLSVSGPLGEAARWRSTLKRWLADKAGAELEPWVKREATAHRLRHGPLTIRWQKTRWGSCSHRAGKAKPTLSLNAGLLFLPPHLVRYVLLHELCHTTRMDHSPAFWKRLERIEPAAESLRAELRSAWRFVPSWLEAQPTTQPTAQPTTQPTTQPAAQPPMQIPAGPTAAAAPTAAPRFDSAAGRT
jgi:predicted metal-dependent hydrolase